MTNLKYKLFRNAEWKRHYFRTPALVDHVKTGGNESQRWLLYSKTA